MSALRQAVRYVGGGVALLGLALSAAFVGRRTADPMASEFVQPFTLWTQLLGVATGLVVLAVGLAIVGRVGGRDRT